MEAPQYYFALPRLLARLRGGSSARTEQNWIEANIVGTAMHLIIFLCAAYLLLSDLRWWLQIALGLPVLVLAWFWWISFLYLASLLVRVLRAAGLLRNLPDERAQSVLSGIAVSACAVYFLFTACSQLQAVGVLWLAAVALNLMAAAILALDPGAKAER